METSNKLMNLSNFG